VPETAPGAAAFAPELQRIRELIEAGAYEPALRAAQQLTPDSPANRDVLYSIAVCQRCLRREPEALQTLERLRSLYPGYSRLYQEIGYCHVGLRDGPAAIEAFLKAVHRNPALPGSWAMLERLYRMVNDAAGAEAAAGHVAILAGMPVEIVTATSMFSDREFDAAEKLVRGYLSRHGKHIEALRLLARIAVEKDARDEAELLLGAVLEMAPDYRAARFDYANVLLKRHRHEAALVELDRLCQAEPANRAFQTTYATACVGLGRFEQALAIYRQLLHSGPPNAELQLSIGHCLKTIGDSGAAVLAYREAARTRPDFGDAYWSLANLKTYRFTDEELQQLRTAQAAGTTAPGDRIHLSFALGKALEDRGCWAESFHFYEQGNLLRKSQSHYRPETVERNTRLQIETCTAELFERRAHSGCMDPAPIFIVGLPRSGSTLIEQILAAHPRVEGTMELADVPRMVLELQGRGPADSEPRYPRVLASLSDADLTRLGERYIADTRIYRRTERPHFIDKMPNNFRHLGLIHLILPRARIIDARREPMACCFSNFKQLFAEGQEFTYSQEDVGRYYRTYVELMRHWESVLPRHLLRVQHEEVVADLEGQVRRLLEFLELEFDPQCLEFHRLGRNVRTASSEQVRRPVSTEGLDQWRNFEPWLGPLREALGPLVR
jgi:predicted Zn-dependent protease